MTDMTEMLERKTRDERSLGLVRRRGAGERLRLPRPAGMEARAGSGGTWRPRGDRGTAGLSPERAAAERAFAAIRDREPGAPLALPEDPERTARFHAIEEALRKEWRRVRAAERGPAGSA